MYDQNVKYLNWIFRYKKKTEYAFTDYDTEMYILVSNMITKHWIVNNK